MFVVAVAALGSHLHEHLTPGAVLEGAWLFLFVWWVWMAYSYDADVFHTEEAIARPTMLVVMLLVIGLSGTADGVFAGASLGFAVVHLALRAILAALYVREQRAVPQTPTFHTAWTASEVLTTLVVAASLLVPPPGRFWLCGLGSPFGLRTALVGVLGFVVAAGIW